MLGRINKQQFDNHFTPKPYRLRKLKKYLDENSGSDDEIYLWGNSPWAPYILQRRPVQCFLVWFHILGVGMILTCRVLA